MVESLIGKQTTNIRESISPTERFSITLRYLATGNTLKDLKFISAIAQQTIGKIVIENKLPTRVYKARRVVEDTFGILASRFGVFQRQMLLSSEKAQIVILACCCLQNFLNRMSKRYIMQGTVDWEDENEVVQMGS
ncbi:hypothetical protein RRG08_045756 [Elysia crispata]|uniref:Uncharacterized protein n=1 Tax=Elysia crispata TaxID=231223 RepID=A0AAE1DBU8_9GAST|nr:hypothetical protein RRG08_045756 [Elysia crispata]